VPLDCVVPAASGKTGLAAAATATAATGATGASEAAYMREAAAALQEIERLQADNSAAALAQELLAAGAGQAADLRAAAAHMAAGANQV
jgi:hypothetical protein